MEVLAIAVLNGLFLLFSKVWAERRLAEMRERHDRALAEDRRQHERDIEHLKTGLSGLREIALRHFDQRAALYWEALEPFIALYIITSERPAREEEIATFRNAALTAAARIRLFATPSVRDRFDDMLAWTEEALQSDSAFPEGSAEEKARCFIDAARADLLALPPVKALPGA